LRRFVEIPIGAAATVDAVALDPVSVDLGGRGLPSLLYPGSYRP
jgi:hypothetical protein